MPSTVNRASKGGGARRDVLRQQPQVKWINVIESDGGHVPKVSRHLVRMNRDLDLLKEELSHKLNPHWGPVRNIYTPAGGTVVKNVDDLEPNKAYAVGGAKFKPIPGFSQIGQKKSSTTSTAAPISPVEPKAKVRPPHRVSLLARQDMIAKKAKEDRTDEGSSESSPNGSAAEEKRKKTRADRLQAGKKYKGELAAIKKPLYKAKTRQRQRQQDLTDEVEEEVEKSPAKKKTLLRSNREVLVAAKKPIEKVKEKARDSSEDSRSSSAASRGSSRKSVSRSRKSTSKSRKSTSKSKRSSSRKSEKSHRSSSADSETSKRSGKSSAASSRGSSGDRSNDSQSEKGSGRSSVKSNRSSRHRSSADIRSPPARRQRDTGKEEEDKGRGRRSFSKSRNSDEIMDDGADTDSESLGHSHQSNKHRLKHGRGSERSHEVNVRSDGRGRDNYAAAPRREFSYQSDGSGNSAHKSRTVEVDYDRDGSGVFRASRNRYNDEDIILDSNQTKVDTPIDYTEATEVEEDMTRKMKSIHL